jgi:hypothetical protein
MDTTEKDLSYFTIRLQEFLNISFPEKAHDTKFIEQRALWATETYERAFRLANSIQLCNAAADVVLFKDLHFSRFDTILQVVSNEFVSSIFDEELKPFTLKILSIYEPVFRKYILSPDLAESQDFNALYNELTGRIASWIEENRIQ